jgi:hypothetical protein
MKRDRMRSFAWVLVLVGITVAALTFPLIRSYNMNENAISLAISTAYGRYRMILTRHTP